MGFRTQGLAGPRTHSLIRSIIARDHESVHRSIGVSRATRFTSRITAAVAWPTPTESRLRGRALYGWPWGTNWKTQRDSGPIARQGRTPLTNLLSLPSNADTPCSKQPERGSLLLWTEEFALLSKPGHADIQSELFYDYRTKCLAKLASMDVATTSLAC